MEFLGMELVLRSLRFAAQKHRNQKRKNIAGTPYINHPIDVACILWLEGEVKTPAVLAAAILHDTIEDTETSYEMLVESFGEEVARYVLEMSDDTSLPKQERKQMQIELAPSLSHEAKLIKIADKISNLRDIMSDPPKGWSEQRQTEYFHWAAAVVDGVRGVNDKLELSFDRIYNAYFERLTEIA